MKKQSLMEIEDFYIQRGYSGERLQKALKEDKEYQKLFMERKKKLSKQTKATFLEKKKYVLSTDTDFEILSKCKQLQKYKLMTTDKALVELIKSQLEDDWRKPLIQALNRLQRKYRKN